MRRNADYRRDWAWFAATWQALAKDYGRAPQRDFARPTLDNADTMLDAAATPAQTTQTLSVASGDFEAAAAMCLGCREILALPAA